MTAPRAFYLTLPNGRPKLLTVNTLGELQDIVLLHYPDAIHMGKSIRSRWETNVFGTPMNMPAPYPHLREVTP